MIVRALLAIVIASAIPANGGQVLGNVRVVDGDTIRVGGELVRFWGIDAPEKDQVCWRDAEPWSCGEAAADALAQLIAGSDLLCIGVDVDSEGLVHAFCRMGHVSISASLVRSGWALDYARRSGGAYAREQAEAKAAKRGLWASTFDMPWVWRNQEGV